MAHFTKDTFDFLFDLDVHNSKAWMDEHRDRYEATIKQPLYAFVADLADPLHARVSRHLEAIPRIQGGSVFQIHRDTRFSDDKTPYKRNAGAWFGHAGGTRKVPGPGMYLHLEPGNCFMGAGVYRPPNSALTLVRERIVDNRGAWTRARNAVLDAGYEFGGDSLKTSPRGFDADDPAIEDLRRTSFVVSRTFDEELALRDDFLDTYVGWGEEALPLLRYLCRAFDLPF